MDKAESNAVSAPEATMSTGAAVTPLSANEAPPSLLSRLFGSPKVADDLARDEFGRTLRPSAFAKLSPAEREAAERAVLQRVDARIVPLVFCLFFVSFLTRTNVSAAAVSNKEVGHSMIQTIGLDAAQFSWISSIFFWGFIVFELPTNVFLKMLSPSRWIALMTVAWGVIAAAMAAATSYPSLLAARFFLGVAQAGLSPGVLYYLTFWYRRTERGKRIGAFYLAGSFTFAIGGLLGAGIVQLDGKGGLFGWQWLFIIEGLMSVVVGVATWLWMPDYPYTTAWLSRDERQLLEWRLRGEAGSDAHGAAWVKSEAWEVAKNPLTYLFSGVAFLIAVAVYGITFYAPAVVASLGFQSTAAIAMQAPLGVFGMIAVVVSAYTSDRYKDRFWHLMILGIFPVVGYAMLAGLPANATGAKLAALFILNPGLSSMSPIYMSWRTDTVYGTTYTALVTAVTVLFGNVAGIVAPQLFVDPPLFVIAFWIMAAFSCAVLLLFVVIFMLERWKPQYCGPNGPMHFRGQGTKAVDEENVPKPSVGPDANKVVDENVPKPSIGPDAI
ncbi:major facilitator superfamily domain-containing protein [Hyaloraphidium curvatum]|nr:major facilitator superfamily domain-containing protein [Hyaloraphidium curvatum]